MADSAGGLPRLCIFARAPEPGRVKTRIAATLGDAEACAVHKALVEDTLDRLAALPGMSTRLWIAGAMHHPDVDRWSRCWRIPILGQIMGDLGRRMDHALRQSLVSTRRAVLVGTDCPDIDGDYVAEAVAALMDADVVLGPAADGGYGLIGCAQPQPRLFSNMPWGSDRVCELTLQRSRRLGLDVVLLETIWDVDDARDWERFLKRRESNR